MRILHPIAAALLTAVAVCLVGGGAAQAAQGRRPAAQARREVEHPSQLATPIANARASLEKLEKDKRRKRYRDGWDAIARELSAAVHRAPSDPRADEARLLVARVREALWNVSRSAADARVAVAADSALDDVHPGSEAGRTGLLSAVHMAWRAHLAKELALAAKKLAKYPRSGEVNEALALAPVATEPKATRASGQGMSARAATSSDRAAVRPVDTDEDESDEPAPAKSTAQSIARSPEVITTASGKLSDAPRPPPAAVAPVRSTIREERAGRNAPPSPEREPDTDVPASAAHLLDQLVQAARNQGASDLVDPGSPGAKPAAAPTNDSEENASPNQAPAESEAEEDEEIDPPVPAAHHTLASAPRAFETSTDVHSEAQARALRKSVLSGASGSMAAQLGLKVRKIVVDAGHGGHDTGAIGPHGLREKEVTLAIARKLMEKLRAAGLEVVMTRDSDEYVSLNERTRIANDANADLFISVHCNAARKRTLSGVETWTLNVSADRYAQRLASFENAEAEATVSNLRMILADLATKANASDARELAETVQSSMVKTLRPKMGSVKDNGVKQALFYVLLGTHMPSILVETAFLSNPEEEKRLKSAKYQDGAAEAIARGVKQYIDARRELARAP